MVLHGWLVDVYLHAAWIGWPLCRKTSHQVDWLWWGCSNQARQIFNFLTSRYCDMESQNLAMCVNVIRGSSSLGTTWYQWSAFENPPSIVRNIPEKASKTQVKAYHTFRMIYGTFRYSPCFTIQHFPETYRQPPAL